MARLFLKRLLGGMVLLGTSATLFGAALAIDNQFVSVSQKQATAEGEGQALPSVVAVKKDVGQQWDYDCTDKEICAPEWPQKPRLSYNLAFNSARAQSAYGGLVKWADFQLAFLSGNGSDYKSIVYSPEIFNDYYLPPHRLSGTAMQQWEQIYASTNPLVMKAYENSLQLAVEKLVSDSISYGFSMDGLPNANTSNLAAGGADQDYARLFADLLTRDQLLAQVDLKAVVFSALYANSPSVPDLGALLTGHLNQYFQGLVMPHEAQFKGYQGQISDDFVFTSKAQAALDTLAERQRFDLALEILRAAGTVFLSRFDNAPEVTRLLAMNWSASQTFERLTDANLKASFNAINYVSVSIQSAQSLADELFGFGNAMHKLDTVNVANRFAPAAELGGDAPYYGPRFVASLSYQLAYLVNLNQIADPNNPDLIDLYDQYVQLIGSGKFTLEDLARYWNGSLEDLFTQQPVSDDLARLIEKAIAADPDNQALKDALAKIQNEGINSQNFASLFEQLNLIVQASSRVTTYVFIGIGAAVALISLTSVYSLARGYLAKRKYGTNMLEYTRSKRMLVFVALVAGVVGIALVAIAAAGAV